MKLENDARAGRSARWRWLKWLVLVWCVGKIGGCACMLPGPWGPQIGGRLPNGHEIYFQSRPRGRESDDRLTWIKNGGMVQHFWVNRIHAGPAHVTVRSTDHGNRAWVEASSKPWDQADSRVIASIDLTT